METTGLHRLSRSALWTLVYTTLCLAWLACGGSQKGTDHYQKSVDKQRACCGQLNDPSERAACIDGIVTVEQMVGSDDADPDEIEGIKSSERNQATFQCMEQHFTCDPTTGKATAESTQAQHDCVQALGSQ